MRSRKTPRPRAAPNLAILQKRLSAAPTARIAVLAVGSTLRGDDAAGILAGRELNRLLEKPRDESSNRPVIAVFFGETAPENLTGQIKEFQPTCLLILDAVDIGGMAGSIHLIEPDELAPGAGASTHSTSLKLLIDYLRHFLTCDIVIAGIQPQTLEFAAAPSKPVLQAAKRLARLIASLL